MASTTDPDFPASAFPASLLQRAWGENHGYGEAYKEMGADGEMTVITADGNITIEAELIPVPRTPEQAAHNYAFYSEMASDGFLARAQYAALMLQTSTYLVGFARALIEAGEHEVGLFAALELHGEQNPLFAVLSIMDADELTSDVAETTARYLRARFESNTERLAQYIADVIHELAAR